MAAFIASIHRVSSHKPRQRPPPPLPLTIPLFSSFQLRQAIWLQLLMPTTVASVYFRV